MSLSAFTSEMRGFPRALRNSTRTFSRGAPQVKAECANTDPSDMGKPLLKSNFNAAISEEGAGLSYSFGIGGRKKQPDKASKNITPKTFFILNTLALKAPIIRQNCGSILTSPHAPPRITKSPKRTRLVSCGSNPAHAPYVTARVNPGSCVCMPPDTAPHPSIFFNTSAFTAS